MENTAELLVSLLERNAKSSENSLMRANAGTQTMAAALSVSVAYLAGLASKAGENVAPEAAYLASLANKACENIQPAAAYLASLAGGRN
jgi:hypothetical protein